MTVCDHQRGSRRIQGDVLHPGLVQRGEQAGQGNVVTQAVVLVHVSPDRLLGGGAY
ncbi:hypothetical protein D3C85_1182850 [compost metagenome]